MESNSENKQKKRDSKFKPVGPYAAILTPFNADGKLDKQRLGKQVDFLAESGIAGIFVCGTTGEFIHLSTDENCEVMEFVAKRAGNRISVVSGTCTSSIENTLKMARKAEELGLPAIVVCPPYYIPLSQEDVLKYYQTLARSVDINIILYNIPMFTNEISFGVFEKLLEEENIIGIKDSSGNLKNIIRYVHVVKKRRPNFSVMTGTDQIIFPALMAGCVGSMTALSGIVPEVNTAIYKAHREKNYDKAFELQMSSIELLTLAESIAFPAGYKIAAVKRGFSMGPSKQVVSQLGTQKYKELEDGIEMELHNILGENVTVK